MSNSFRLSDLVPEPLTLTDDAHGGDGTVYDVLTADLLSEVDMAALMTQQRRMAAAFAADRTDEALQACNAFVQILIPSIPAERLRAIPLTFKARFIEFWQQHHAAQQPSPKAPATDPANLTPVQRGRRSRASSPPTESPLKT